MLRKMVVALAELDNRGCSRSVIEAHLLNLDRHLT